MKKLFILIILFTMVGGLYSELDWKKGVQIDVRPEGGITVDNIYFNTKDFIKEYPDRVMIKTEFNTKYCTPIFMGLPFKTNYSIDKFTNQKLMVTAKVTTQKGSITILLTLLLLCLIVSGYFIMKKMRNK